MGGYYAGEAPSAAPPPPPYARRLPSDLYRDRSRIRTPRWARAAHIGAWSSLLTTWEASG